jgi:hypothetical protein
LRTHDLPAFLGAAAGRIKAQSDAAFARLIARFVDFYRESLFNPHWGEQIVLGSDNTFEISMVSQDLDREQAREVWRPFFDWVGASPEDFIVLAPLRAGAAASRGWWDVEGNPAMIPDTRNDAPKNRGWWQGDQGQVGAFVHGFDSIWLPASLLHGDRRQELTDALFAASRHKQVALHMNKGLAGAPPDALAAARQTATNPEVVDAFALAIIADGEAPAYPGLARPQVDLNAARDNARTIASAAAELRKLDPNGGSYVSESNYFNGAWQDEYWGANYSRLREIKTKYDPDGIFFVHHGVGSEDWSDDGFTRLD